MILRLFRFPTCNPVTAAVTETSVRMLTWRSIEHESAGSSRLVADGMCARHVNRVRPDFSVSRARLIVASLRRSLTVRAR
jgi:hypothetical protein